MTRISLLNRTAVITGAGRGLGRAYATEFASRGAAVVVNDVDGELADEVVGEIESAGGSAVACADSVATADGAARIIEMAMNEYGSLEILVNNAGVLRTGYFTDLTDDQIDIVLSTHLRAAFALTRLAWPLMSEGGHGRLIMTSSSSGLFSHQGLSNYAAAKAGLFGLTKALAFEGADLGIQVNAILPMAVSISPAKDPIPDMEKYRQLFGADTASVEEWRRDPRTIAALVAYLCSDECDISGEAFSACNGRYARVFVGIAEGWLAADETDVTAEQIADHMRQIRDLSNWSAPNWLFDEVREVVQRIAAQ